LFETDEVYTANVPIVAIGLFNEDADSKSNLKEISRYLRQILRLKFVFEITHYNHLPLFCLES